MKGSRCSSNLPIASYVAVGQFLVRPKKFGLLLRGTREAALPAITRGSREALVE